MFRVLLFFIVIFSTQSFAEQRLVPNDYKRLVDLGYSKLDAYGDDYTNSKPYWFKLEEHLEVKPKYLILVTQKMKVNGKETENQHIYNSRHHFFGDRKSKCIKKKKGLSLLSKCEYLKPKIIDDNDLPKDTFAKMALDHCNELKVKNLITAEGKKLEVTDTKKCSIKYLNFSKYEFAKVLKKVGKKEDEPKSVKTKKSAQKKDIDLEKFKKQCKDLGFRPRTEKFGDCVLRLLEASN
jgi:hypothetical protein